MNRTNALGLFNSAECYRQAADILGTEHARHCASTSQLDISSTTPLNSTLRRSYVQVTSLSIRSNAFAIVSIDYVIPAPRLASHLICMSAKC
jgi:hypothetical protein